MPFEMAEAFEFATAMVVEDTRQAYPEQRFQAVGLLDGHICQLVFTPDPAHELRIISLRRASPKERRAWLASRTRP